MKDRGAGGFKGKSRSVERKEFLECCEAYFGIPAHFCVNLLGLTEIASQFYDNNLKNHHHNITAHTVKIPPSWTRTLVVDPERSSRPGENPRPDPHIVIPIAFRARSGSRSGRRWRADKDRDGDETGRGWGAAREAVFVGMLAREILVSILVFADEDRATMGCDRCRFM